MRLVIVQNFNSIKVQLELETRLYIITFCLFQFHKGTIRTLRLYSVDEDNHNFNSIKVQLERKVEKLIEELSRDFNSIKVQLEPPTSCSLYRG